MSLNPAEESLSVSRPVLGERAWKPRGGRRRVRLSPIAWVGLMIVSGVVGVALLADLLAPVDPWTSIGEPFLPPSLAHPFGTDDLGRDLLTAVIHGTRTSLAVGFSVASLSATIGMLIGGISGYLGGLLDDLLMRLAEFFQVIPRFFLVLLAVALFQPGILTITLVLGLTAWPMTARLLRAQVLSVREREYVTASRALGASHFFILRRDILPNSLTPVVVHSALMVGQAMLIEASLAFLGLGDPNHISWGYLLNNAQPFLRTAWWMPFFPGLALTIAVLGFNFAVEGVYARQT